MTLHCQNTLVTAHNTHTHTTAYSTLVSDAVCVRCALSLSLCVYVCVCLFARDMAWHGMAWHGMAPVCLSLSVAQLVRTHTFTHIHTQMQTRCYSVVCFVVCSVHVQCGRPVT
ncbi:MAG TPA: hypothetical protein V6C97_01330 [Oculatellaceae cyanobacterium]